LSEETRATAKIATNGMNKRQIRKMKTSTRDLPIL
jgi:hypothetical protein